MVSINLQPINSNNWKVCIALSVAEDQKDFLPNNLYSIAEAQFYPEAHALAIYNHDNQMVGFILYGRDTISGKWKIFRLMIDAAQQRKGYGQAAMEEVIKAITALPDGNEIIICYHDHNQVARELYARLGFCEQSVDDHGKVTALLKL